MSSIAEKVLSKTGKVLSKKKKSVFFNNLKTSEDTTNKIYSSSCKPLPKSSKRKSLLNNLNTNTNAIIKTSNISEKYNDYELNTLAYQDALRIDKRAYCEYYQSLLRRRQLLIFIFYTNDDYNSKIIKISVFLFSFSLSYTTNALFFSDSTMHKIYMDHGKFNFIYQAPQIIYSTLICNTVNTVIEYFSLFERNILEFKRLKKETKNKVESIKKIDNYLKIKAAIFFALNFSLLIFFWYYLSCFCALYKNTQIQLISDTLISFGLSQLYPFGLSLLPVVFRIQSLKAKEKNKECMFNFSKTIQLL